MPLPIPNLDDRDYGMLRKEALDKIRNDLHTNWDDLSPGDPGVVLLEAFAFLTEQMIYRLNRVPEKAYIAFLNMLGVGLKPPSAAKVALSFWQDPPGNGEISVPRGTQVATELRDGEFVVFTTIEDVKILNGNKDPATAQKVMAYNATWVEKELLGKSTELPGQVFPVSKPPILARVKGFEIELTVEIPESYFAGKGKTTEQRIETWREVDNFAGVVENEPVYRVDRQAGIIQFAPAAFLYNEAKPHSGQNGSNHKKYLAAVPPKGALIRVGYPTGGGIGGNVPADVLKVIQSPDLRTKLKVTNLEPARGGMDAENLQNALVRGPQEVFTQKRLITARDFERWVLRERPDIACAHALALQDIWEHARPGKVNVILVPALRKPGYPSVDSYTKDALESEQARLDQAKYRVGVAIELEAESPLGVHAQLDWAHYKQVAVHADVIVPHGTETGSLQKRLEDTLYRTITAEAEEAPEYQGPRAGWNFGAELHLTEVLRWIFDAAKEGIKRLSKLELRLDSAPVEEINALAADYHQANTWYATSGSRLFRTTNNAAGWEELLNFAAAKANPRLQLQDGMENPPNGQALKRVCPSCYKPGLVALAGLAVPTSPGDPLRSYVYLSADCGENWIRLTDLNAEIDDMDWLQRSGKHILLLATSNGLEELHIEIGAQDKMSLETSNRLHVMANKDVSPPVYAVKVLAGHGGKVKVAVAMAGREGVYLSQGVDLDQPGAFTRLEHDNLDRIQPDIRCLGLQWSEQDNRFLLWAGGMAFGPNHPGGGCCRWVLDQKLDLRENIGRWFNQGWTGGSCLGLAFLGYRVLAATARGSILVADIYPSIGDAPQDISAWKTFNDLENVLPVRKIRFEGLPHTHAEFIPFTAIASNERLNNPRPPHPLVLVGCDEGVFASQDAGLTFIKVSRDRLRHMTDMVTIPPNWLLVSGQHQIRVIEEEDTGEASSTAGGLTPEEQAHETG